MPGPVTRGRSRGAACLVAVAAALAGFASDLVGQTSLVARDRAVVLTFDDLPMTGGAASCDAELVEHVTSRLTSLLAERGIPSAALATPGRDCVTPELLGETLSRWQTAGAVIGNHTATHPDLNSTSVEAYAASIDRGQGLIDAAVETDDRWFRPPLLHSGDTPAKKAAIEAHLAARGYRVAAVTVDNQEWVYAAVYQHARDAGDEALAARVVDAYLAHLEAAMAFYEELSVAVFGREIPQTLLLHANLLNADHLGRVIAMLEARGYRFVDLDTAFRDAAYAREDTYVGPRGLSWLQRWALEDGVPVPPEPREAAWVAETYAAVFE